MSTTPAHTDYPVGTIVRIPTATGTRIGVRSSDGRWRRLGVAPNDPGASNEETVPRAIPIYVPEDER